MSFNLNAITKISVSNGNWNHPSSWNPASIPLSEDTIIVTHNLIIDERTEFGATLLWIKTNGSLTGDSLFGLHGDFLNDGFIDLNNIIAIGDGNSSVNNGTIQGNHLIPGNLNNLNNGTIGTDTLTLSEIFINNGTIATASLVNFGSASNNSGATITATDMTVSEDFKNNSGATITATNMTIGDGIFHNKVNAAITVTATLQILTICINDGDVSCFDLTQVATISGTNGKFCIANFFKNPQDSILGSVDICDATPAQGLPDDVNFGYVANTVTLCAVGPCSTTTSTNELNNAIDVNVYPNPSAGNFNINADAAKLSEIEIYNFQGKKVLFQSIRSETAEIDLSKQPNGVYLLQMKTNGGPVTKRIIINQ